MTIGVGRVHEVTRPEAGVPKSAPDLVRGLNLTMSTAIIVGTMVGTGIFLKPSEVANQIRGALGHPRFRTGDFVDPPNADGHSGMSGKARSSS